MRAILDLFPQWYQGFLGLRARETIVDRRRRGKFIAQRQFDRSSPMGYFPGSSSDPPK
jgi:hypothetical protein